MFFRKKQKEKKLSPEQLRLKMEFGNDYPLLLELWKATVRVALNKQYESYGNLNTMLATIESARIKQNFGERIYMELQDFIAFADGKALMMEFLHDNFAPANGFQLYDTKRFSPKIYLGTGEVKLICSKCGCTNNYLSERCGDCGSAFYPPLKRSTISPYELIK